MHAFPSSLTSPHFTSCTSHILTLTWYIDDLNQPRVSPHFTQVLLSSQTFHHLHIESHAALTHSLTLTSRISLPHLTTLDKQSCITSTPLSHIPPHPISLPPTHTLDSRKAKPQISYNFPSANNPGRKKGENYYKQQPPAASRQQQLRLPPHSQTKSPLPIHKQLKNNPRSSIPPHYLNRFDIFKQIRRILPCFVSDRAQSVPQTCLQCSQCIEFYLQSCRSSQFVGVFLSSYLALAWPGLVCPALPCPALLE